MGVTENVTVILMFSIFTFSFKVVLSVNVTLCLFSGTNHLEEKTGYPRGILEGYESNPSNESCRSSQDELNLLMWDCAIIINFDTIKVTCILLLKSNYTLQLCLFFNIFIEQSM